MPPRRTPLAPRLVKHLPSPTALRAHTAALEQPAMHACSTPGLPSMPGSRASGSPVPGRSRAPCPAPRPRRPPISSHHARARERCATHSLGLESGNGLELGLDVVVDGLEALEELLALGDHVLVLEHLAVVLKVDGRLLLLDGSVGGTGGGSTAAERVELGKGLCVRAAPGGEGGGDGGQRDGLPRGSTEGRSVPRPRPSLEVMRVQSTAAAAMVSTSSGGGAGRGGAPARRAGSSSSWPVRSRFSPTASAACW